MFWWSFIRCKMEVHKVESYVWGFHIYANIWSPTFGNVLNCERESRNPSDLYAVTIKNGASVINGSFVVAYRNCTSLEKPFPTQIAVHRKLVCWQLPLFFESTEVSVLSCSLSLSFKNFNNAMLHELIRHKY